ncbi:sigma-54 interaction domain-containing protein [Pseudalkalibacillus decolorationis]|uniref:sigma-54 interaction domain-containing protein n=1 Tax=Pseudalkalibacillus decolorationis TaxID=163879 RepID=UPI002147A37A|nr:sigma 54-interacting transcriptional regulator [Pseudalkalibacillus decolorationis]
MDKFKETNSLMDLEVVVEAFQEGIAIYDGNLKCLCINSAYTKITGIQTDKIIGNTSIQLVKEGLVSNSIGVMVMEAQEKVSLIQTFRNGNDVLVTGQPVYDENGEIYLIVFTARDVTTLNTLQNKLRDAEERSERYLTELTQYKELHERNPHIVANSKKMQLILENISMIGKVDSPVLITGKSGTGKEVLSKLIHDYGREKNAPFVKINCGAIPGHLLESELFGYVKGAFTGADNRGKPGLFEIAENGTLLLDEISELPLNLQVKLLRVLQDFEITRLGSTTPKKVKFRLITATNRSLEGMLEQGKFREDLYYRINVIPIQIPPLKERIEDIHPLINKKLNELCTKYNSQKSISAEALNIMEQYHWPGNIRELINLVERLYVMTNTQVITPEHLPIHMKLDNTDIKINENDSLKNRINTFEKKLITDMLKESQSLRDAAKKLKVDPSTLSRKCKSLEIELAGL